MSALSATSLSAPLPGAGLPPIDPATEPASVRNGNQAAKNAYQTGLGFEDVLVNELSQQLTATISGSGDDSDGLGGSSDDSSGSGSATDPAAGAYSSLLPGALTQGIMSTGGTGIAMQIAEGIDPALALGPGVHSGHVTSASPASPASPGHTSSASPGAPTGAAAA